MKHLIIGTAGHVDHGKSVLIKALTGIDTDRLQEEKRRGISIDLGFASFSLPGGRLAGVVDVPGHERFIHNMLAGAGGMDLVLLVVDATEGVMPQTREHLQILELLNIHRGIVVITKIDLVETEWLELVKEELREELSGTFLKKAPLQPVSAITGEGIAGLKQLIDRVTDEIPARDREAPFRMPLDRSFSSPGFGTIVTGTLIQGMIRVGDKVDLIPPGITVRVRNLQVHGTDRPEALAGQRVALNLTGLERREALRGAVVCAPGYYRPTSRVDVVLRLLNDSLRPIKNMDPVHFYSGTARVVARLFLLDRDQLAPGEKGFAQCRLERPLVMERRDRFIIRSYSPVTTIGGGAVLDPFPGRHRRLCPAVIKQLAGLEQGLEGKEDPGYLYLQLDRLKMANFDRLKEATRLSANSLEAVLREGEIAGRVIKVGDSYIGSGTYSRWVRLMMSELDRFHGEHPLLPGISRAHLKGMLPSSISPREFDALLEILVNREEVAVQGEWVARRNFSPRLSPGDREKVERVTAIYSRAGWSPPPLQETIQEAGIEVARREEFAAYLLFSEQLVKITEELYFHADTYREALAALRQHFKTAPTLTLAQFRDITGSSRKIIQPLLEHFDQRKVTRRVGDHRVLVNPGG
ncbi:MAG: selenocysteine-specific translation elongation factor [Firmicutes bacterium]|nr:selenocysteine-specific translation elongation factor [Bacillota bacterium]